MPKEKFAIIIGSNNYSKTKLNFPIKDAIDFASVLLNKCDFVSNNVFISTSNCEVNSLNKDHINEIFKCIDKQKKNKIDLIIFYYSGHGKFNDVEKKAMLQLSDNETIYLEDIMSEINNINAKNKYLIIDACETGNVPEFISKNYQINQLSHNSDGIYIIYGATYLNEALEPNLKVSKRKEILNSFLTHYIIEAFNKKENYIDNYITFKSIDNYATIKTVKNTNFKQIPCSNAQNFGAYPLSYWKDPIIPKKTLVTKPSNNRKELKVISTLPTKSLNNNEILYDQNNLLIKISSQFIKHIEVGLYDLQFYIRISSNKENLYIEKIYLKNLHDFTSIEGTETNKIRFIKGIQIAENNYILGDPDEIKSNMISLIKSDKSILIGEIQINHGNQVSFLMVERIESIRLMDGYDELPSTGWELEIYYNINKKINIPLNFNILNFNRSYFR